MGKATSEDGTDGTDAVSIFKEITQDEDYIHFKLQDDSVISVPKHHPLSITFSETEDIRVLADKTYSIGYTITGADENTVIKALAQDGFRAVVKDGQCNWNHRNHYSEYDSAERGADIRHRR